MDSTAALPEDSDTEQMDLDVPDEEEEEPVEVPTEIELHPLSEVRSLVSFIIFFQEMFHVKVVFVSHVG